jgi:hypothetical protein
VDGSIKKKKDITFIINKYFIGLFHMTLFSFLKNKFKSDLMMMRDKSTGMKNIQATSPVKNKLSEISSRFQFTSINIILPELPINVL